MILDKIFAANSSLPKEQNPLYWVPRMLAGKSAAGVDVTETSAMTLSSYFACVRNLAEDIAALPITTLETDPASNVSLPNTDNEVYKLLKKRPNPIMQPFDFRVAMVANAASWGNSYAEIVRDTRGRPSQLWPIHPSRVHERTEVVDGVMTLVYEVFSNGTKVEIPAADMLHIKGLTLDGITGISIISAAAQSLGVSLAEQEFTGKFLANGASLSGVLTHPKTLNSDAFNRLRQSWGEAFKGSSNAGKPAILEQGMEWNPLSIPQRDAQFLEQRLFSVTEAARWFRMPPHKIMHLENATYSNIESQDRQYVTDTLLPWLLRIEGETTAKLFTAIQFNRGMVVKHNVDGRLRGDLSARADYYTKMIFTGAMTINESRALENQNPIGPQGDVHFMQSAMATIDTIINPPEPPAPVAPAEPEDDDEDEDEPDDDAPPPEDDDPDEEARAILLHAAATRVVNKTLKATERERDDEWLGKFYHEQASYLAHQVAPICKALKGTLDVHHCKVSDLYDADALTSHLLSSWRSL